MTGLTKRLWAVSVGLVGLALLGLVAFLTLNRLEDNRRLWQDSLSKQGAFILASLEAASRAGMRGMAPLAEGRLQILAEELVRVGLVKEIYIIDREGRIVIHSDPNRVGRIEPRARELWSVAQPLAGGFGAGGFEVARLFRPRPGLGGHAPPWMMHQDDPGPRLGVVVLSLDEYRSARQAEVRQALFAGGAILVGLLAVAAAFLFLQHRRLLDRLRQTTGHLIDQMPAGLIGADQAGRVLTANLAAGRIFGRAAGGLPAEKLSDFLDPDTFGQVCHLSLEAGFSDLETKVKADQPGRSVPVALSAVRLSPTPEDPTAFILLLRDLSQVKDLEEKLQRSERLAALGRLSAAVAHEIRNPLSSIRGLAQFLQGRMKPESEDYGYAGVMIGEADRLNRVVGNLLTYARPRPPLKVKAGLNDLAGRAFELLKEQAQAKGVELQLNLAPDLPELPFDPDQITQVVINLVLNALESGAGKVEISSGRRIEAAGKTVWLGVSDDGPGISEADQAHVFEPFFTTKPRGSGLGLAISQRIAEEHGGRLALKDSGQGASFELTLPVSGGEDEAAQARPDRG